MSLNAVATHPTSSEAEDGGAVGKAAAAACGRIFRTSDSAPVRENPEAE